MDNVRDAITKHRMVYVKGERHGFAKLTREKVEIIRTSPETNARLAILLDMNRATLSRVRRGVNWK